MIHKLKNSKGYALVTVLLMITIFMVLGLSFMNQSFNTTKQVAATETKVQSVDLAEMGAEFYKNAIENELEDLKNAAKQAAQEEVDKISTEKGTSEINEDDVEKIIRNEAQKLLKVKLIDSGYLVELRNKETSEFRIGLTEDDIENKEMETVITFKSIPIVNGNVEEKSTITSVISIDFSRMNVSIDSNSKLIENAYPDDALVLCEANRKDFTNKECRFNPTNGGKIVFGNNDATFKNSVVKVYGDLVLGKPKTSNDDSLYDTILIITGNLTAPNNGNWDISDATIYVGGEADLGNFNNASNVKLCVNNLEKIKNTNNTTNLKVYVKSTDKVYNNSNIIVGEDSYAKNCSLDVDSKNLSDISWNDRINYIDYEY